MKYCTNCGNPLENEAQVCDKCQTPQETASIPETPVSSEPESPTKKKSKALIISISAVISIAIIMLVLVFTGVLGGTKALEVHGDEFNFTDKEIIDWMNDNTTYTVEYTDIGLFSRYNFTTYDITSSDGRSGFMILSHSNGNHVRAVMFSFEDWSVSAALSIVIGEAIDPDFSKYDALVSLSYGESYSAAGMTVEGTGTGENELYYIAPTSIIDDIFD